MPLGVLNDNDFEKELESLLNPKVKPSGSVEALIRGRGHKSETPEELRKVIAQEAIVNGDHKEIAKQFGVSESSVSAYKNGATSTASYNTAAPNLASHVDAVKDELSSKARKNLMAALDSITPESFDTEKLKVRAQVARDMSAIIKNLEPEVKQENSSNVVFQIYAPQVHKIEDYKTIDVEN